MYVLNQFNCFCVQLSTKVISKYDWSSMLDTPVLEKSNFINYPTHRKCRWYTPCQRQKMSPMSSPHEFLSIKSPKRIPKSIIDNFHNL